MSGLIIAAAASGSGKTVLTLGLLRHLARSGVNVASAKAGPDYIDPEFHRAATSKPCINLDSWAMRPSTLAAAANKLSQSAEIVICEGVMGLFDGTMSGQGSTADLAAISGWPVVLVVDARAQGASAAAVVKGFASICLERPGLKIAGVIFNRTGGGRHVQILQNACARHVPEIPLLGFMPRHHDLHLPERHLGLIQAGELDNLETFLDLAADLVSKALNVKAIYQLAKKFNANANNETSSPLPPLGQRISVASDAAFRFSYPLVIDGWRAQGCDINFFSPLADQGPADDADAVYLPGGYPELHGGKIAAAGHFLDGLRQAAARDALIFGECGGYMVLGQGLGDADANRHTMAGLLPLETSFTDSQLHLGYRRVALQSDGALGRAQSHFRGHEFHYTRIEAEGPGSPLFMCSDAEGIDIGPAGLIAGRVMGSFIHLIDCEDDA